MDYRIIETLDELRTLKPGSVVMEFGPDNFMGIPIIDLVFQLDLDNEDWWAIPGQAGSVPSSGVVLPVRVLWDAP